MDLANLKLFTKDIEKGKKKFKEKDITEAIVEDKEQTYLELEKISIKISLNNEKTKEQILKIRTDDIPNSIKTYRGLNPYVGAVLLRKIEDKYLIYGSCRDANNNDQHAEYTIIKEIVKIDEYSKDDILFTTLEPCTKNSRKDWSISCSDLIINYGLKNIYIGSLDPNPLITGQGVKLLLDNNVNVFFYNKPNRDLIKKSNEVFLKQFDLPKGDPQKYKDIFDSFHDYINYDTLEKYIALTIGNIQTIDEYNKYKIKQSGEKYRHIFEFFREMVMNRSILLADREVSKFICTNDFALFFFESPKKIVDGASIRIINKVNHTEKTFDCSLYQVFDEIAKELSLIYPKEEGQKTRKSNEGLTKTELTFKYVEEQFNKKTRKGLQESIIKELLINSLVHRDYNSPIFTEIIIDNDCIEIKNPINEIIESKIDKIKSYSFGSNPINARLMRFFMDIRFCERKSHGLELAKKFNITYSTKNSIISARFEKYE